jgi:hypothetical protein
LALNEQKLNSVWDALRKHQRYHPPIKQPSLMLAPALMLSRGTLISQDCIEHLAACTLDVTLSIMPIQNIGFLNLSIHSKTKYKELLFIHHHMIPLDKSKATAIP